MKKLITIILLFPVIINSQFTWNQIGQTIYATFLYEGFGTLIDMSSDGSTVAAMSYCNNGPIGTPPTNCVNSIKIYAL